MLRSETNEADMADGTISEHAAREKRLAWWRDVKARGGGMLEGNPVLAAIAEACGTDPGYIRLLVYGHRRPRPELAQALGEHSGLPRQWWRPDVWG
jgi:phytoene/squalene synthetase